MGSIISQSKNVADKLVSRKFQEQNKFFIKTWLVLQNLSQVFFSVFSKFRNVRENEFLTFSLAVTENSSIFRLLHLNFEESVIATLKKINESNFSLLRERGTL